MTDIVTFIKARLDEDEAVAHAAALQIAERAVAPAYAAEHVDRAGKWVVRPWLYSGRVEPSMGMSGPDRVEIATVANEHIARHDPARVLREVEAKRQITECHESWVAGNGDTICGRCGREHIDGRPGGHFPCQTLRLLALPFTGHPDYREDWRP
jgi:hypothetical protein